MIKFHAAKKSHKFKDIEENQFFISEGCLYVKYVETHAVQLTDSDGVPYCRGPMHFDSDELVLPLPHVEKITWEVDNE